MCEAEKAGCPVARFVQPGRHPKAPQIARAQAQQSVGSEFPGRSQHRQADRPGRRSRPGRFGLGDRPGPGQPHGRPLTGGGFGWSRSRKMPASPGCSFSSSSPIPTWRSCTGTRSEDRPRQARKGSLIPFARSVPAHLQGRRQPSLLHHLPLIDAPSRERTFRGAPRRDDPKGSRITPSSLCRGRRSTAL